MVTTALSPVALPDVPDGQVSAPLLADIRRGFEMVSISFQVPEGEQVLLRVRDQAVAQKDYPAVQAVAVVFGAVVLLANFAVDLFYAVLDPRVRLESKG